MPSFLDAATLRLGRARQPLGGGEKLVSALQGAQAREALFSGVGELLDRTGAGARLVTRHEGHCSDG